MLIPVTLSRRLPPEFDLLALSFLGHFSWEILQAPLFASMSKTDHFVGIAICLEASLGDIVIAVGLLATIGLEYLNTEVTGPWTYDEVMPLLPVLGTGLSPILQWVFVPMLVLWYLRHLTR